MIHWILVLHVALVFVSNSVCFIFLVLFPAKMWKLFFFVERFYRTVPRSRQSAVYLLQKEDGYSRHTDSKMPMTSFWDASFSLFCASRASLQLWMLYDYNDNDKLYYYIIEVPPLQYHVYWKNIVVKWRTVINSIDSKLGALWRSNLHNKIPKIIKFQMIVSARKL